MNQNKIVTINGHRYDAHTGMPLDPVSAPKQPVAKRPTAATTIHSTTQKSKTLVRRATKKPVTAKPVTPLNARPARRSMDIARSSKITRFAPATESKTTEPKSAIKKAVLQASDIPASTHPVVAKALASAKKPAVVAPAYKPAKEIKEEAIAAAIAKPGVKPEKVSFRRKHPRVLSITAICLVIVVLAGYITYLNMPNLSVAVAASQVGIDAKYPDYRPDGYSIDGPVTFGDSAVTINFKANTGNTKFTFKQTRSSWDSSAVLDNIVHKQVGEDYITSQVGGLTIYSFKGNAAWVNGGILYTITGDAPLSSDQIRRIATSL